MGPAILLGLVGCPPADGGRTGGGRQWLPHGVSGLSDRSPGPHHRWRAEITPDPPSAAESKCSNAKGEPDSESEASQAANHSWAELMQRGLQIDTLACSTCGGRFRHIANIMTREAIRRILRHLGLQSEPPDLEPAALPTDQTELFV